MNFAFAPDDSTYSQECYSLELSTISNMTMFNWIRSKLFAPQPMRRWSREEIDKKAQFLKAKGEPLTIDEAVMLAEVVVQNYFPQDEKRTEQQHQEFLSRTRGKIKFSIDNPSTEVPEWQKTNILLASMQDAMKLKGRTNQLAALQSAGVMHVRVIVGRNACAQCKHMDGKKIPIDGLLADAQRNGHWCNDLYIDAIAPLGPNDDPEFADWLENHFIHSR